MGWVYLARFNREDTPVYKLGSSSGSLDTRIRVLKSQVRCGRVPTGIESYGKLVYRIRTCRARCLESFLLDLYEDKLVFGREWFEFSKEDLPIVINDIKVAKGLIWDKLLHEFRHLHVRAETPRD